MLSSSPMTAVVDQLRDLDAAGGLRERLSVIVDPRSPQGLRHSLTSILLITVCALAAGKNGYTAIEAWARDAPTGVLTALGVWFDVFAGDVSGTGARTSAPDTGDPDVLRDRLEHDHVVALTGRNDTGYPAAATVRGEVDLRGQGTSGTPQRLSILLSSGNLVV